LTPSTLPFAAFVDFISSLRMLLRASVQPAAAPTGLLARVGCCAATSAQDNSAASRPRTSRPDSTVFSSGNQFAANLLFMTHAMMEFIVMTGAPGLRHYATSNWSPWHFSNQC